MTHLKPGDPAPHFESTDQDGNTVSSATLKGKKFVLYFYPKDNTPTCTTEACNLRDNYLALQQQGYEVLGVSPDSPRSHKNFIAKHNLPFSLLADQNQEVAKAFAAWAEKSMCGRKYMGILRSTFVIDEQGKIEKVIANIKAKDHAAQIL